MNYEIQSFKILDKFGKNCRVFLTGAMKGSFHPLAKNLLIPLPTGKMFNMFNMQRMLFLALKKVPIFRNTACRTRATQQKMPPAKCPIAPIGEMPLPLNTISKTLNCPFVSKEDFLGKLTNISIIFVYLLFSIMPKCFIKNP